MRTAARRALRGKHLGQHAAERDRAAGASGHCLQSGIARARLGDQFRRAGAAWIRVEKALQVGEDHERVGLDQIGHQGRQRVVVPEPDLVGCDRVVFVDDRDDGEPEERAQRGAGVEIALAVGEVVVGEQQLRCEQIVRAEARFIGLDQPHLADGGGSLQLVQGVRPPLPAEALHARGDGSAGNQHHFAAHPSQLGDLPGPARERIVVEPPALVGDQARANLDDDAFRLFQYG